MITQEDVKLKTEERFWSKIKFGEPDECWEWQASVGSHGYGMFGLGWVNKKSRVTTVHTYIFKCLFGMYSKKLWVLHTCDNRKCCNPSHLWLGTQQQNNADMVEKGRARKAIGSKAGKAILNEEKVIEIKRRILIGNEAQKEIAIEFGVKPCVISNIKRNVIWKSVQL